MSQVGDLAPQSSLDACVLPSEASLFQLQNAGTAGEEPCNQMVLQVFWKLLQAEGSLS